MNNDIQLSSEEWERRARGAASRAHNRVGLGLFLFLLIPQVLVTVAAVVATLIDPAITENVYFLWGTQFVALYLITTPIALLVIGRPSAGMPTAPKTRAKPTTVLTVSCLMMSAAVAGSIFSNVLMAILGALTGHSYENTTAEIVSETPIWLIILLVVIVGPLCEELVFRRALMDRLLPFGELGAILVSGITFGLMHGNLFQLFYTVAVGFLLAYIYAKTRNFLYPLFLHMGFNFIGSVLPVIYLDIPWEEAANLPPEEAFFWLLQNALPMLVMFLHVFLMYGAALAGVVLLLIFYKNIRFSPAPIPLRGAQFRARLLNAGMILFAILGVVLLGFSLIPI